jgi:recombination protein RecR
MFTFQNDQNRLFPHQLRYLMDYLQKFPGVGEKTSLRFALAMTQWNQQDVLKFSQIIEKMKDIKKCSECFCLIDGLQNIEGTSALSNEFLKEDDDLLCSFCSSDRRKERKEICVVETYADFLAIAKSGEYKGLFHILGGVLNPLLGIGVEELTINKLFLRIKDLDICDLILALNPTVEGDVTSAFIRNNLPETVKVERIGLGMPMGGSLEYLDVMTINKAMENRRIL